MMWILKLFLFWLAVKSTAGVENIELEITQGKLIGLKNVTVYHSMPFYSFRGIPYAKPNVGRDKFNIAVPLDSWLGVLDATKHGNICAQVKTKRVVGHEDCLFLNVYTRDVNETAGRAVMVFIHGGEFVHGSGNDFIFGPDFLIEKDIVLVTMNYRLGVIGFLNTGDNATPGNVGLKDQNLALKWVQKNIAKFGGSPDRVTIFGQGTGAACVHYHMLSSMSKGLFKSAILQSGAAVNPASFTNGSADNMGKVARFLRINATNTTEVVEELRGINLENYPARLRRILSHRGLFLPAVEIASARDVFLSANPWELMTTGDISDVPVLVGVTENEIAHLLDALIVILARYENELVGAIPNDLNVTDQVEINSIIEKFNKVYFNGLPITSNSSNIVDLYSDAIINHGSLISAEILNARMSSPVYQYLYKYKTPHSIFKKRYPRARGVLHGDDLTMIFFSYVLNNSPELGSSEAQKVDEIVEMWTNFAKEGSPSPTNNSSKIIWEPMGENKSYLAIGTELEMKTHLWRDRVQLWGHLYKNLIGDYVKLFD